MAGVNLLLPGEFIPAGTYSNTTIGEFTIVPRSREGWRMFGPQSSGQSVFRGRFVNKPGGFTQIVCQITTPTSSQNRAGAYGAAAGGLEATILTLNSTSVQNGNTWFMPCFRLQASGTAGTNDTDARLVALFGFPVDAVICNQAIAGMPWKAGDNLLDQMGNFRGFAL